MHGIHVALDDVARADENGKKFCVTRVTGLAASILDQRDVFRLLINFVDAFSRDLNVAMASGEKDGGGGIKR
jgi:hypothetical protein